jgi:hypothetical protein
MDMIMNGARTAEILTAPTAPLSLLETPGPRGARPLTRPSRAITSVSFLRRARQYRLAAAISDARRDVKLFLDLATTFELLSEHFARAEVRLQPVRAG